jgi:hypothetical protein
MEVNMKRINKLNLFISIIVLLGLDACNASVTSPIAALTPAFPTSTQPSPIATSISIPVIVTPSPLPKEPIIPIITPDPIQVERWKEYEDALAKIILKDMKQVLCEWEILGRSDQQVYVWAVCQALPYYKDLPAPSVSVPAVIYLGTEGAIQNVETTRSNWSEENLNRLFPAYVQEKFDRYHSGRARKMLEHLELRRGHPEEPPLIVLNITPTP